MNEIAILIPTLKRPHKLAALVDNIHEVTPEGHSIYFMTDDPEEWFINCIEYRTKSGIVVHDSLIIAADLKQWVEWHQRMGWEKI